MKSQRNAFLESAGRLTAGLVRRRSRALIRAFIAVGALAATLAATGIKLNSSVEGLMLEADRERVASADLKNEFSNDEVVVIAFDLGHAFTAIDLRGLHELGELVEAIAGVEEVLSLATIEDVRGTEDTLDASPLFSVEGMGSDLSALHDRVRAHELYQHNLVSDDLSVLAAIVVLEPPLADKSNTQRATRELIAALETAEPPWPWYIAGYPINEYQADRIVRKDLALLGPAALTGIVALVLMAFRRGCAIFILLSVVAWSACVSLAWFALTGTELTMVTSAVPAILLASSATYAIYALGILSEVSHLEEPGVALAERVAPPALLSALSTGIGFLSLRLVEVSTISDLGTALSVGIAAAALASMLLVPALVQHYDLRLPPPRRGSRQRWALLGVRFARRPLLPMSIAALAIVIALPGINRIRVESDPLGYFDEAGSHRVAAEFIRSHLSGTGVVNIVLRGTGGSAALDPDALRALDGVLDEIGSLSHIDRTISFLDYILLIEEAMRPNEAPRRVLPTRELAAQYMLLYEAGGDPADYRHYINFNRSALNAFVRSRSLASTDILEVKNVVDRHAAALPSSLEMTTSGSLYLLAKAMDSIANAMMKGLLMALVLIGVVMSLSLRSMSLAAVAAVPNTIPIIVWGGIMGWAGIPLSVGTSVVGCIALGLAVDDTAHVLGHLRSGSSLDEIYRVVARPLFVTTFSLGIGFAALTLSEFQPVWALGAATAVTLFIALLCDWLLLPALLSIIGWPLYNEAQATDVLAAQSDGSAALPVEDRRRSA